MRLIDAEALKCELDISPDEWAKGRTIEAIIDKMPTVEHYGNIDISANAVLDSATRKDGPLFRETDEMCPRCQRDLEVYYCENRTYIVRCKHCHIVTLVSARNPYEAAAKVGLHAKPVRHGRWKSASAWEGLPTWMCSVCDTGFGKKWKFCPSCGAKMDGDESD